MVIRRTSSLTDREVYCADMAERKYRECYPYSAFERGSNKNGNRIIRRRLPKGTSFVNFTGDDVLGGQRWVNEYLRSILGGRSAGRVPREVAEQAGVKGIELLL